MSKTAKERFEVLLKKNKICVLSTASSNGKPEVSFMQYAEDSENNIYFKIFNDSRKYPNIKSNPNASVAIHDSPEYCQLDGTIKELSGNEAEEAKKLLIEKCGDDEGYYNDSKMKYFRFTPSWIRVRLDEKYPPKFQIIKE